MKPQKKIIKKENNSSQKNSQLNQIQERDKKKMDCYLFIFFSCCFIYNLLEHIKQRLCIG